MAKKKYTKEEKKSFRKKNKKISLFTSLVTGMFLVSTAYFILNLLKLTGIETVIRYIFIGLLVLLCLYILRKNFKLRSQPKKYKFIIFILLLGILGFGEFYVSSFVSRGIKIVDNLNKDKVKYTSYLIAMNSSDVTKKNIASKKVGIISDTEELEGYELAQSIIKKDKISDDKLVKYDEYITMLKELYSGEIDAAFVQSGYIGKYSGIEQFENIQEDVKVVDKYSKLMKKQID